MGFKDMIKDDLDDIFFKSDEFSNFHNINNKEYNIMIDNQILTQRKLKDNIENVFIGDLLFYIKTNDIDFSCKIDAKIKFDNATYLISNVIEDAYVTEITLARNIGR